MLLVGRVLVPHGSGGRMRGSRLHSVILSHPDRGWLGFSWVTRMEELEYLAVINRCLVCLCLGYPKTLFLDFLMVTRLQS
jgi:hypothetical protein